MEKIEVKGDRVFLKLEYTPKHENLKKKMGNLPVMYLRTVMSNVEKDLPLFETAMKRFKFSIRVEEDTNKQPPKKKLKTGESSQAYKEIFHLDTNEEDEQRAGCSKEKDPLAMAEEEEEDEEFEPSQRF